MVDTATSIEVVAGTGVEVEAAPPEAVQMALAHEVGAEVGAEEVEGYSLEMVAKVGRYLDGTQFAAPEQVRVAGSW